MNWYFGWGMILAAFLSGAMIGLFSYSDGFLEGYGSYKRRILRLGHVALAALGMINILYSLSSATTESSSQSWLASTGFLVGGITMPLVCFLSSWRAGFRHFFFIPVVALLVAVVQTLLMGSP